MGSIQKSTDQIIFATPNEARSVFFLSFCTTPPCRMISSVLFLSATAVRCVEVTKELRSNLILYISQGRSRGFLYISHKGSLYPVGQRSVYSLSFSLCPVVAAFVPVCRFFLRLLSRVFFGAGNCFSDQTDGMGNK